VDLAVFFLDSRGDLLDDVMKFGIVPLRQQVEIIHHRDDPAFEGGGE